MCVCVQADPLGDPDADDNLSAASFDSEEEGAEGVRRGSVVVEGQNLCLPSRVPDFCHDMLMRKYGLKKEVDFKLMQVVCKIAWQIE